MEILEKAEIKTMSEDVRQSRWKKIDNISWHYIHSYSDCNVVIKNRRLKMEDGIMTAEKEEKEPFTSKNS